MSCTGPGFVPASAPALPALGVANQTPSAWPHLQALTWRPAWSLQRSSAYPGLAQATSPCICSQLDQVSGNGIADNANA